MKTPLLLFILLFAYTAVFSQDTDAYVTVQGERIFNYASVENGLIRSVFKYKRQNKPAMTPNVQDVYFSKANNKWKLRVEDVLEDRNKTSMVVSKNKGGYINYNRKYIEISNRSGSSYRVSNLPVFQFAEFLKKKDVRLIKQDSVAIFFTNEYNLFVDRETGRIKKISFTYREDVEYSEYLILEEQYNQPAYAADSLYDPEMLWDQYPDYLPYSEEEHGQKALKHTNQFPFPLSTADGLTIDEASLAGKPVLIYAWYRSCYPCIQGIPKVQKFKDEHGDAIHVVGLNVFDDMDQINAFCAKRDIAFPMMMASEALKEKLWKELYVSSYPFYWLYDETGKLVAFQNGRGGNIYKKAKKTIKAQQARP